MAKVSVYHSIVKVIKVGPYTFDGRGIFAVEPEEDFACGVCGYRGILLRADNSGEEYGSIFICRECLMKLFDEAEQEYK